MKDQSRNTLVGLFVLGSLVALGSMMIWFGEVPDWLATGEWTLQIVDVEELSGVGEGSPVNLNGVEIGRVTAIDFADPKRPDEGVVIMTRIKQRFTVPRGAFAKVYGATLGFGSGHIDIIMAPTRTWSPLSKEGAKIRGEIRSVIGEMISMEMIDSIERAVANIADLASEVAPVARNFGKLIEQRSIADVDAEGAAQRGMVANLATVLERLDRFVANLNTVLGDDQVQDDVKLAVHDLKAATEELRDMVKLWNTQTQKIADNVNSGIDLTKAHLDTSFIRLTHVLENMDAASKSLANALQHVAQGDGTVGLLVKDERLYEAAVLAVERFALVMADLQVIVGKVKEDGYVTVGQAPSGLLRKNFPVGPGAKDATTP